jgi:hypothetical protein
VVNVTWRATTRIKAGVGDLVQRIRDDQEQVSYSVEETRSEGFLL